ncbi:MAG: CoA transferase [Emcibacter sp.]|nr:CoA transferase [Emcibacter sp.]
MYNLLKGLSIVEGASFIAGPSATMHMAQMGAEVIRFDNIGGGPDFNRWPLAKNGQSLYWEGMNKGKKSIALNLSTTEGRELAIAIATAPGENAGLFVTNYPVNGFLSYDILKEKRADLICLRVMGWADGAPAMDPTVNAASGIPMMTGPQDDEKPVNQVLPAWDLITGAYAAFAMTAAILDRKTSGKGHDIRLPLADVAISCLSHTGQIAEVLASGADRPRMGNDMFGALGRDFETKDGKRVMIVALTTRQWIGLVRVLNLVEVIESLEQSLNISLSAEAGTRFNHRDKIIPLIIAAIVTRNSAELYQAFDKNGVTWGPYQTLYEAVTTDDRMVKENPMFTNIDHPSGMSYPAAGPAATLPGQDRGTLIPAPHLGQHTDEVLAMKLGLPDHEIGRLHDKGIIAGMNNAKAA